MAKRSPDATSPRFRFRWLDAGIPQPDGSFHFQSLEVEDCSDETPSPFVVHLGDTILLRSNDLSNNTINQDVVAVRHYEEDTGKYFGGAPTERYVARVELMKEDAPSSRRSQQEALESRMKIRARWFLKKSDLETLELNIKGDLSQEDILANATDNDLVLTNHVDDNQVGTMIGPCSVIYRKPDASDIPPGTIPENCFVCRYSLEFKDGTVHVKPFDGEDDDWDILLEAEDDSYPPNKKTRVEKAATAESDANESTDDHRTSGTNGTITSDDETSVSSNEYKIGDAPEAEGTTTKGSIQVGLAHQVAVPPFRTGRKIISRNPTLIWKPDNVVTDERLVEYFDKAADILTSYLEQNGLTSEDPYSPITAESTERFIISQGRNKLFTLSSVSTASSLSSKRNRLLRECSVDYLLEVLQKYDTNMEKALAFIEASPSDFVTCWTKSEKEVFDARFRSYSGQLRMIGKSLAPNKSFKDVVDFYYRFKIPDQYRRYQEKKREQAVRMVECIETRRSFDNIIRDRPVCVGSKSKATSEWSRTGTADVIGAIETRRAEAKDLLLEVRSVMGPAKMAEVADAVRSLSEHSVADLKYSLSEILHDQPELLQKFLGFLPKRLRN